MIFQIIAFTPSLYPSKSSTMPHNKPVSQPRAKVISQRTPKADAFSRDNSIPPPAPQNTTVNPYSPLAGRRLSPSQQTSRLEPKASRPRIQQLSPARKAIATKEYQKAARKWTASLIAFPIFLVTSYYLVDRLVFGTPQKSLPRVPETSQSAHLPPNMQGP